MLPNYSIFNKRKLNTSRNLVLPDNEIEKKTLALMAASMFYLLINLYDPLTFCLHASYDPMFPPSDVNGVIAKCNEEANQPLYNNLGNKMLLGFILTGLIIYLGSKMKSHLDDACSWENKFRR